QDNKCKHFFHHTFSPFDNNAGSPSRVSCVKNAIGGLYVVNSLYAFSCEINTNYVCGCICINLRGEDSRINCYQGLKVVSQPLLRFSLPLLVSAAAGASCALPS